MRNSGGEELLFRSGLCQEETAKKIFSEKADYYQSLHALKILTEAVWQSFWEAFQNWLQENKIVIDEAAMATATQIGKSIRRYILQDLLELNLSHFEDLIE